ncbi:peptide chain release factor 1 [Candidatus Dojkabacteria bacterium]|nr:peptide chain release factor 1 [Candidatus Dojkabacteria bacterium]
MNIKSLEVYKSKLAELTTLLSSPDLINTHVNFKSLSQESSELQKLISLIEDHKRLELQQMELTELLSSTDEEMSKLASEEKTDIETKLTIINKEIAEILIAKDPNDKRNAIVEIRAGTGGEEAALFAADLFRMYSRYCEKKNWTFKLLNSSRSNNGGYKEIIFHIEGLNAFGNLKYEGGVHRVQRIPTTESSGRIHTSAVSVVVLAEVDDINIEINANDLRIDVYRSGGPGGQSVNTTDSAVRITHIPTNIVVTCQDGKSQLKNKERALSILKSKIYELEQTKQSDSQSNLRNESINGGDRSAKIRTYNFQQSRITDHRIKKSWYNFNEIMDGELSDIIISLNEVLNQNEI